MQIYLVGGAVRDQLLGLTPKERDWVVVGGSAEQLQQLGYKRVGKDFPVFLHPTSKEEYALARIERKVAAGYAGFEFDSAPKVTLEEDLLRRDLTINAIAQDEQRQIIDPYGGRADIEKRILRHVSPAFSEDPVRILRVARFAAQFAELGFTVAVETVQLMREMVANGEVDALVAERVWKETQRGLATNNPQVFFETLRSCGALARLFPEVEALFGVPQTAQHHPEIDTGVHTMMVLQQAARLTDDLMVRFAALVHDLGKGTTPQREWPKHIAHEERGVPLVKALCERLRVPKEFRILAVDVARYHLFYHRALELTPKSFLKVFDALKCFQIPQRLDQFLLSCEADSRGRLGYEDKVLVNGDVFHQAFAAAQTVGTELFRNQGLEGPAFGEAMHAARIKAIGLALKKDTD